MGDERDERLRDEWAEHAQQAALGANMDLFRTRAGRGPETPEERAAREGAPEVEGPPLDELLEHERGPVVTNFTAGAFAVHAERHEGDDEEDHAPES